jgi:hypothetical protein
MQLSNAPSKLVLPFANSGAKNTIPAASQIGITAGAASLTDGFPPLTRTPIAAGGVPPSGLDMNGILNAVSAITRWANAGAGYVYDATFAADSNVGGYPKGARVLRTDGLGYWINTTDNNTTDPEAGGAGWLPDFTTGATAITMTSSNVTLTPLQYGKQVIVITGTLTANVQLIFPAIVGQWAVINSTSGAYTITAKTSGGSGVVLGSVDQLVGDGTNIYAGVTPDASTTVKGKVQLATSVEAQAGTDALKALTPATLNSALKGSNQSLSEHGYQKLPGGLIVQWGFYSSVGSQGSASITFPVAFPSLCLNVQLTRTGTNSVSGDQGPFDVSVFSVSGFTGKSTDDVAFAGFFWFAIGY